MSCERSLPSGSRLPSVCKSDLVVDCLRHANNYVYTRSAIWRAFVPRLSVPDFVSQQNWRESLGRFRGGTVVTAVPCKRQSSFSLRERVQFISLTVYTIQDTMKLLMLIGVTWLVPTVCSSISQFTWRCQTKVSLWQQWTSTEGKVPCLLSLWWVTV